MIGRIIVYISLSEKIKLPERGSKPMSGMAVAALGKLHSPLDQEPTKI